MTDSTRTSARKGGKGLTVGIGVGAVLTVAGIALWAVQLSGGMVQTGMRNISAGAVLAAQYFPGEVMFPVMMGTLFQQVLAACFGSFMRRLLAREDAAGGGSAAARA